MQEIDLLYASHKSHQSHAGGHWFVSHEPENTPDLSDLPTNEQLILWLSQIWKAKGQMDTILLSETMIAAYARTLAKGLQIGYSSGAVPTVGIDYNTPDKELLEALTKNTWHFSAAKNHHELRTLTDLLKDDAGKLRTWNEFKPLATEIHKNYAKNFLRTEYEQAVSASQNAAQWVRIEAQRPTLPRLRYSTAGDERVRGSHRLMDAVVRPVDDPFWNTHYPPNGWGCRCMVEQVDSSISITPDERLPTADEIPKMFQTNVGRTGLIFPKEHPYFIDAPLQVRETADKLRMGT